jgi:hypothetical protein
MCKAIKSDHAQHEMDEVYAKQDKLAAAKAMSKKINPHVKSVSLWTLHGHKRK